MKNRLFFGMIVCAALAIGLVLAGCDTGAGGDSSGSENTDSGNTGGNGNNTGGNNTGGGNNNGGSGNSGGTGGGDSTVDPSNGASISLTSGTWEGGVVASFSEVRWYKYSPSATTYLWWHADQTNSYNGQIRVTAYKSDGTQIFSTSTEAWSSAKTITDTGTIYLKVEKSDGSWGATYGIVYSTSSSKPTLSSSKLSKPANVTAAHADYESRKNTSRNSIKITWSPVSGAISYDIYEWVTYLGGYWNYVAMNVTGTEYTHTGLEPATSHSYMVCAVRTGGYEGTDSTAGGNAIGRTAP
jgi:hypothetical protein